MPIVYPLLSDYSTLLNESQEKVLIAEENNHHRDPFQYYYGLRFFFTLVCFVNLGIVFSADLNFMKIVCQSLGFFTITK